MVLLAVPWPDGAPDLFSTGRHTGAGERDCAAPIRVSSNWNSEAPSAEGPPESAGDAPASPGGWPRLLRTGTEPPPSAGSASGAVTMRRRSRAVAICCRKRGGRWWPNCVIRLAPCLASSVAQARVLANGFLSEVVYRFPSRGAGMTEFALHPIGLLRTPFRTLADCPRNGRQPDPPPLCEAELFAEYAAGLKDLDGFSHLILLYWMHQARTADLVFRPPFAAAEHGLFATRSPNRPNPIGLSVVAFEGFAAPARLMVRYLDCLDGTPLLDIKPYLPRTDAEPAASMGWLQPGR
jgi:tRNA-Thr(GGU) m(6)t(6)A37 methyltransferase TsaA